MSQVIIEDAGWAAIMADPQLQRARQKLSFHEIRLIVKHARAALVADPPKHKFWGAGEPDCPREIKAGNGELHTLRCKACGLDNPRSEICGGSSVPQLDARTRRLVLAARNVAFGLQTPITDPDDFALFKELDAASETFATDIPWGGKSEDEQGIEA